MHTQVDRGFMQEALALAKRGQYTARPNPAVGCVLVKEGRVIARGFHAQAGTMHAEAAALAQVGGQASGATAYVTLEPCSHFGRTPPCAYALIAADVARVVIAHLDPNPKAQGGAQLLTQAGIEVVSGVLEAQAHELNRGFFHRLKTKRPYVRLKVGMSLDGRTALADGRSKWITSAQSRADVQHYRALSGALITGSQTIIDDNPRLNVRLALDAPCPIEDPALIVLDRRRRLHHNLPYQALKRARLWHDDLPSLLDELGALEVNDVLVEAGAGVVGAFIAADLVNELIVYQAPIILGASARSMAAFAPQALDTAPTFTLIDTQRIGDDLRLIYRKDD